MAKAGPLVRALIDLDLISTADMITSTEPSPAPQELS
jgi:hypothetical protein